MFRFLSEHALRILSKCSCAHQVTNASLMHVLDLNSAFSLHVNLKELNEM
jgi:hypothetical protein